MDELELELEDELALEEDPLLDGGADGFFLDKCSGAILIIVAMVESSFRNTRSNSLE
ncbi:MAG: hypothetical protein KDD44_15340 [Bdellovibrionales bacterium]|nr:hypothetical protein [Bdellovibrionales bacterium]